MMAVPSCFAIQYSNLILSWFFDGPTCTSLKSRKGSAPLVAPMMVALLGLGIGALSSGFCYLVFFPHIKRLHRQQRLALVEKAFRHASRDVQIRRRDGVGFGNHGVHDELRHQSGSTEFSDSVGSKELRTRSPNSSANVWQSASAGSGEGKPLFFISFFLSRRIRSLSSK